MRQINNFDDINIVVKELQDRIKRMETKDRNMHGLRLTNAADAIDDSDYITKRQLPDVVPIDGFKGHNQNYEIIWTPSDSTLAADTILKQRYIVGEFRVGMPVAVYLYADHAPTTDLAIDIMWNSNTGTSTEINLLKEPLVLGAGLNGPVVSRQLNTVISGKSKRPIFSYLSTVRPKIVTVGAAAGLTICVEVIRMNLKNVSVL